jgi:hypothetical protein
MQVHRRELSLGAPACRHYRFLGRLQANTSRTCIHTDKDSPYSTFTGDSAYYSQVIDYATYYSSSGPTPLAWSNQAGCEQQYHALCEVPVTVFTCPAAPPPPPAPPTSPPAMPCEGLLRPRTASWPQ